MSTKTLVWIGMVIGSTIGGFIPGLWNGSVFAYLVWSGVGGIAGIYFGFKLGRIAQ